MPKIKSKRMKVLFCAAEAVPLAKIGGLADVVGSLPAALKTRGIEARIIMPAHHSISLRHIKAKKILSIYPLVDGRKETVGVYEARVGTVVYYLLSNKKYFNGDVYEGSNGRKYLFFSRAVISALDFIAFKPDVIHAHDFHAAPVIAELGKKPRNLRPGLVLTIHNLRHQGIISGEEAREFGFDIDSADSKRINLLAAGIIQADKVTTVSPNYAQEILTAEYGCGLERILRKRRKDIVGILNGIDVVDYNPRTDRHLAFNVKGNNKDVLNKKAVRAYLGLEESETPLFAFIARLSSQKGLDLFDADALAEVNKKFPFQLVILGAGEKKYEKIASQISQGIGNNAKTLFAFDETIARSIYAACDFFLMPSLFEPCGLAQMIAMRYGGIPLVRETGGLKDTVIDGQTGLRFKKYLPSAFTACFERALRLYYDDQKKFKQIQSRCFNKDWSWAASTPLYERLYRNILSR